MIEININNFDNKLSSVLSLLDKDGEIILKDADKVLAKLTNELSSNSVDNGKRPLGKYSNQIKMLDGFDECDKEIEKLF